MVHEGNTSTRNIVGLGKKTIIRSECCREHWTCSGIFNQFKTSMIRWRKGEIPIMYNKFLSHVGASCYESTSYLLIVRSFANPSSLSTQRSKSSFFLDLDEVLGAIFWASAIVTILWKSWRGLPSAVHNSLALFSYITCNYKETDIMLRVNFYKKINFPMRDMQGPKFI